MFVNRKDKDQLIIIGVVIAFILISVAFIYGTVMIPVAALATITLLIQCFGVAPAVNQKYYQVNGAEPKATRFVPFLNEVQILSPTLAKATVISVAIAALIALSMYLPVQIRTSIAGIQQGLAWGYNAVVAAILVLVLTDILLGAGLCGVLRNVNLMLQDELEIRMSRVEVVYYFLAFIPCLRICYFITVNQKLKQLVKLKELNQKEEFIEEEE